MNIIIIAIINTSVNSIINTLLVNKNVYWFQYHCCCTLNPTGTVFSIIALYMPLPCV